MELIQNNPYRIAGILSNATERELQRNKSRFLRFAEVGKEIESEYDFNSCLQLINRNKENLTQAFSQIQQNQDKVNYALFWFLNASPFDNTAIEYLKNGDEEKAVEIWEKVTKNKEVNSKNFSAFNNLGTYKLLSQTQNDIKEGIEAKIKLIESDFFENFVRSVTDNYFKVDSQKQSEKLIDELLTQFNNQFSSSETLQLFSGCNGTTQKYLSKKFTEEPIHKIESQIESCKKKRKENKGEANKYGYDLYKNCKNDLSLLKSLLGTNDLKYKAVADQLANEIMQCGIDYFNEWKEKKDPSEEGLKLLKSSQSIAIGLQTKDRTTENIEGIQDWAQTLIIKDDLDAVVALLNDKIIKNKNHSLSQKEEKEIAEKVERILRKPSGSFEFSKLPKLPDGLFPIDTMNKAEKLIKQAIPYLMNIKSILGSTNPTYLKLSTSVVAKAQNYVIETINAAQKPRFQVFGLEESIDLEYLKSKLKEAWKLVQRIGSLDIAYEFRDNYDTNKKTLRDLCVQLNLNTPNYNYSKIPQLNFVIKDSELTNTDGNNRQIHPTHPLYDKFVRYLGLNLNVISRGTQTINFFLKYVDSDGKLSDNSKASLNDYTTSSERIITPNTKTIRLEGWGNSEKSVYKIGDNSLEVWVNNFMIYKKGFTVDYSPSQKIQKEINKAESKLKKIAQTNYFASEIKTARNEMSGIQKFKLFRGSSEKQRQIESQQKKIDQLTEKSKEKKKKDINTQEERIYKLKMELSAAKY